MSEKFKVNLIELSFDTIIPQEELIELLASLDFTDYQENAND
jgi:hypothetical protein